MLIHKPLYHIVKGVMKGTRYLVQKLWWEPLFKSQCEFCGRGLRVLTGIPLISQNLIIRVGNNVGINGQNTFSASSVTETPTLEIGDDCVIGHLVSISTGRSVKIGKNCLMGSNIFIADNNGHPIPPNRRRQKVKETEIRPVVIGNNVWLGQGVFIGPGVNIGDNSIIGYNSVVVSDIPANCIAAGAPARVIRHFTTEEIEPVA
jgi:acetyltransferase-like isoleucine patch superfamily enzyme